MGAPKVISFTDGARPLFSFIYLVSRVLLGALLVGYGHNHRDEVCAKVEGLSSMTITLGSLLLAYGFVAVFDAFPPSSKEGRRCHTILMVLLNYPLRLALVAVLLWGTIICFRRFDLPNGTSAGLWPYFLHLGAGVEPTCQELYKVTTAIILTIWSALAAWVVWYAGSFMRWISNEPLVHAVGFNEWHDRHTMEASDWMDEHLCIFCARGVEHRRRGHKMLFRLFNFAARATFGGLFMGYGIRYKDATCENGDVAPSMIALGATLIGFSLVGLLAEAPNTSELAGSLAAARAARGLATHPSSHPSSTSLSAFIMSGVRTAVLALFLWLTISVFGNSLYFRYVHDNNYAFNKVVSPSTATHFTDAICDMGLMKAVSGLLIAAWVLMAVYATYLIIMILWYGAKAGDRATAFSTSFASSRADPNAAPKPFTVGRRLTKVAPFALPVTVLGALLVAFGAHYFDAPCPGAPDMQRMAISLGALMLGSGMIAFSDAVRPPKEVRTKDGRLKYRLAATQFFTLPINVPLGFAIVGLWLWGTAITFMDDKYYSQKHGLEVCTPGLYDAVSGILVAMWVTLAAAPIFMLLKFFLWAAKRRRDSNDGGRPALTFPEWLEDEYAEFNDWLDDYVCCCYIVRPGDVAAATGAALPVSVEVRNTAAATRSGASVVSSRAPSVVGAGRGRSPHAGSRVPSPQGSVMGAGRVPASPAPVDYTAAGYAVPMMPEAGAPVYTTGAMPVLAAAPPGSEYMSVATPVYMIPATGIPGAAGQVMRGAGVPAGMALARSGPGSVVYAAATPAGRAGSPARYA